MESSSEHPPSDLFARATLRAVRRVLRAVELGSRRLASATGLTPSQMLVLQEIAAGAAPTPGAAAQRLQFSHATITAIVDRLVSQGLVIRTRSELDRRQSLLSLTPEGQRQLADAPDLLQQVFAERFNCLPAWEQAMVLAGTERLVSLLGAEEIDAAPLLDAGMIDRPGSKLDESD